VAELKALGCEMAQGFLYSRPVDAEHAFELLCRDSGRPTSPCAVASATAATYHRLANALARSTYSRIEPSPWAPWTTAVPSAFPYAKSGHSDPGALHAPTEATAALSASVPCVLHSVRFAAGWRRSLGGISPAADWADSRTRSQPLNRLREHSAIHDSAHPSHHLSTALRAIAF